MSSSAIRAGKPVYQACSADYRQEAGMFQLAPVSLWLEDFSGVKKLFDTWRKAGVTSLRDHLLENPSRIRACTKLINVIQVNREALRLFQARDFRDLAANMRRVFREEILKHNVEELVHLWEGKTEFTTQTVNYTLSGRRIDVQIKGSILPGHEEDWERILLAIEDITEFEAAQTRLARSEAYARGLFQHSPVSLWVEDFSSVKRLLDELRETGISDFRAFVDANPGFVRRCIDEIRVLDVNRHTLQMFGAPSLDALLGRIGDIFHGDTEQHFKEELIDLWDGKLFQHREFVNYTLDGEALHVHMQLSVLPGHEHDWSLVQVALTDITARKQAEAYLEYLGTHDELTKLYNRSFHVDELARLERQASLPVTIIIADLNGLKPVNDRVGHAAGDALLRRVGEVLSKAAEEPCHAARIGGDEFAIVLPASDDRAGETMMNAIRTLAELNNQYYATPINLSLGAATSLPGERLEDTAKRADARMYAAKREYYAAPGLERRMRASAAA
jgi:diguanylate cyclase (GGDEF)-like protein/PAS domain S-box-containing protein